MWYIIHAKSDLKIVHGLKQGIARKNKILDELQSLQKNKFDKHN